MITFDRLKERISERVHDCQHLVLFDYYEREMSDIMLFTEIARKNNRILVYEPESAHLINRFFGCPVNIMIPDTYEKEPEYLAEIKQFNNVITKDTVLKDPEKYMVQITYANILEVLDYRNTGALFLHHSGPPLGDFDPKLKNLRRIVDLAGLDYWKSYFGEDGYFSPHAENCQILAYIDMVNASLTIPCHTSNRKGMIANLNRPYFYAEEKKTYVYDRENNTMEEADHE